jgi:hypothetical protein
MGRYEPPPNVAGTRSFDEDRITLGTIAQHVREWAAGRWWWIRLPLIAYLAYALLQHLREDVYGSLLFAGVTFAIHELGHIVFSFLPMFGEIAAGSVAQLAVPLLCAWLFWRQPDYFAVTVMGAWLAFSMFNVATYVADARLRELPLIGPGAGEPIHDWNYILDSLGMLEMDAALAALLRFAGGAIGLASIAAGLFICWVMWQERGTRRAWGTL